MKTNQQSGNQKQEGIRFSVLMSVYAGEEAQFFDAALQSIHRQSVQADEVVLVVDGPLTPQLEQVLSEWKGRLGDNLRIVRLVENRGLAAALNEGLAVCRNEWVARMDTDDVCLPDRLATQAAYLQKNPEVDVLGSLAITINREGKEGHLLKVPVTRERIRKLIWACPLIHPSVCFKRSKILAVGGYNPGAGPRQDDYDLWYRCAAAGYVMHNLPQALILFRFTEKNIRRNTLKVGYYRLKTGIRGNRALRSGVVSYVGVMIPFLRALLPYPANVWMYKMLRWLNPRTY